MLRILGVNGSLGIRLAVASGAVTVTVGVVVYHAELTPGGAVRLPPRLATALRYLPGQPTVDAATRASGWRQGLGPAARPGGAGGLGGRRAAHLPLGAARGTLSPARGAVPQPPRAPARCCFGLTPRSRLKAVLSANGLP
jgi:hypothetical protein